jgi:signal transduction histidine kinase
MTSNKHLDALLLCPTGQDANLIASVLAHESVKSKIAKGLNELCEMNYEDAGVIIVAEEALTKEGIDTFNRKLSKQKAWSDIPIILLGSGNGRSKQFHQKRLESFVTHGNVTLLERPLQPLTLLSATQVALRARKRQYQVKDLLQSQQEATRIRDEFISIASHELKTPLTSLKLQTQMTKRQITRPEILLKEKMTKQLEYTINQVDRLNKLVDAMLDISRINTGKFSIHRIQFNFSDLLEELIERFTPQFEAVGITIKNYITPGIIVFCDTYKIEQVVNNLFSNVIRYAPHKTVKIGLRLENNKVVFNVEDEGMGIAPENLERIFKRFERISSTISGLGLGLYITRQILNLHQGTIRAESKLGVGSNFIIELPAPV